MRQQNNKSLIIDLSRQRHGPEAFPGFLFTEPIAFIKTYSDTLNRKCVILHRYIIASFLHDKGTYNHQNPMKDYTRKGCIQYLQKPERLQKKKNLTRDIKKLTIWMTIIAGISFLVLLSSLLVSLISLSSSH
jgi:hypothetical protein